MEIVSLEFISALAAIVVIDLVLAGDNAIIIALAAHRLPAHLQRRAIIWGTFGAIAVRSMLTIIVVWLLKIPGLMLAGGALLLWIAYRLLAPQDENGQHAEDSGPTSFFSAMKTIIVADTVMGLDNVLAVAGAAHGSYLLVVLGLLISVPIVIWGSTLILRWIERYPALVYLGAGILAATGVRMMLHEPLVTERFEPGLAVRVLLYLALTGAVLGAGFRRNHLHLQARIWRRHAELSSGVMQAVSSPPASPGQGAAPPVKKILVPVDGSANSEAALRHVIDRFLKDGRLEVHLLNVQAPLSRHISRLVPRRDLKGYQRDRAEQALLPGRNLLQRHSVPHSAHISTGDRAQSIVAEAKRLHCEQIVIGTARHKSLTRMLEDSVTAKILELTQVPVEIVTTGEISPLERYALAGGLAALAVMLLLAIIY